MILSLWAVIRKEFDITQQIAVATTEAITTFAAAAAAAATNTTTVTSCTCIDALSTSTSTSTTHFRSSCITGWKRHLHDRSTAFEIDLPVDCEQFTIRLGRIMWA